MKSNPIPTQPETLLPCPNPECRSVKVVASNDWSNYYIYCPDCFLRGPRESTEMLGVRWNNLPRTNTRAAVTAPRGDVIHWKLKAGVAEAMCGAAIKGNATLISDWATCEKCKVAAFGYQTGRADERAATSSPTPAVPSVADAIQEVKDMQRDWEREARNSIWWQRYVDAATYIIGRLESLAPAERTRVEGEQSYSEGFDDAARVARVLSNVATSGSARRAAEEIADRWFRSDLPEQAKAQSSTRIMLRMLAEDVVAKYAAAPADNDAEGDR